MDLFLDNLMYGKATVLKSTRSLTSLFLNRLPNQIQSYTKNFRYMKINL